MVREGHAALNEFVTSEVTIGDAIAEAVARLAESSDSPRLDAELLLARAIDVPRSYLIAHPEDTLDTAAQERLFSAVEKRRGGMPIAYITGEKEFWSLTLMVSPATLVPRPETELLVEQALTLIPRDAELCILDLGTGSGAIALAIAKERPLCRVVATDVSANALAIAKENARQLDVDNVTFLQGDWTAPVAGQTFDMIVCNPPYVRAGDPALGALAYEPQTALVAGADGLDAIRRIAAEAGAVLVDGGTLLVEHGADQEQDVARLFAERGWTDVRCFDDLAGLPRVTRASRDANSATATRLRR